MAAGKVPRNSAWHKFEHRYWGERGAPFTLDRDDLRLQVGRVGPEATRSGKHRLPILFFFLFFVSPPRRRRRRLFLQIFGGARDD